jgi:hypothetical protein
MVFTCVRYTFPDDCLVFLEECVKHKVHFITTHCPPTFDLISSLRALTAFHLLVGDYCARGIFRYQPEAHPHYQKEQMHSLREV